MVRKNKQDEIIHTVLIFVFLMATAVVGGALGLAVQYGFHAPDRVFTAAARSSLRTPHFHIKGEKLAIYGVQSPANGPGQVWIHNVEKGTFKRLAEGQRIRGTKVRIAKVTDTYVDFSRQGTLTRVILTP